MEELDSLARVLLWLTLPGLSAIPGAFLGFLLIWGLVHTWYGFQDRSLRTLEGLFFLLVFLAYSALWAKGVATAGYQTWQVILSTLTLLVGLLAGAVLTLPFVVDDAVGYP